MNNRFRSNYFLKKEINNFYLYKKFNFFKKKNSKSKIYKNPNFIQILSYLAKIIIRRYQKKKSKNWNVALFKGLPNKINHKKSIKAESSPYFFYADPFFIRHNSDCFIFVEKFEYKKNKGKIVVLKLNGDKLVECGDVIEEKFHLSYPFIFRFKNKYYLIPDSSSNFDIRIYLSNQFPFKWRLYKILKKNIYATDTTLIKFKTHWKILTNLNFNKFGDLNSELHIFRSKNPLSNEWKYYKNNPIILDPDTARNGGYIKSGKIINRVYQKHKFNDYGNSV